MMQKNTNSVHEKLDKSLSNFEVSFKASAEKLEKTMTINFYLTLLLIFLLGVLVFI